MHYDAAQVRPSRLHTAHSGHALQYKLQRGKRHATTEKLDSGLDPYIRCVYAKIRLGKYWLASEIKTQQSTNPALTFYGSYSWSETEQECCLALINNKLQFYNDGSDVSMRTGASSDFAEMEGINVVLPTDLLGTCADLSIELLAKVYDDSQFFFKKTSSGNYSFGHRTGTDTSNTYDYIQFLIKDFAARLLIPATTLLPASQPTATTITT